MLKVCMYRYFIKNRIKKYINVLNDFVQSYNEILYVFLNSIVFRNVIKLNEVDVWVYQYLKLLKIKSVKYKFFYLKVNDMVRISYENIVFKRVYNE